MQTQGGELGYGRLGEVKVPVKHGAVRGCSDAGLKSVARESELYSASQWDIALG